MARVKGEATVMVAVNVPSDPGLYKIHARRVQKLLQQAGYTCMPLNGEGILRIADDINKQLEAQVQAEKTIQNLISQENE